MMMKPTQVLTWILLTTFAFLLPGSEAREAFYKGDPHLKTWTGKKFDYHGECDLVLIDNPSFADGLGLKLHVRTTRVEYFSYIERAALQIGEDVLEFDNDVENFLINGNKVEANHKHHKTMLAGFVVRRYPKAISVRLADGTGLHGTIGAAKIDFKPRKNGHISVIVDDGNTTVFEGSLGLLGEWGTGRTLARDGKSVIPVSKYEATEFALEWQVMSGDIDGPMLFSSTRYPQFPTKCTPPKQMLGKRLGDSHMRQTAEKACTAWGEDKEECIFDVMATRSADSADLEEDDVETSRPNFMTFGGEMYDFHGECDLVLLHNPDFKNGLGMDIHIRTKIEAFWSSVESAVVKLGDDTLEIRADPRKDEWLWFNGQAVPSTEIEVGAWKHHNVGDFLVRFKEQRGLREANLYLDKGGSKEVLELKAFEGFLRVDVNWEGSPNYVNSVGLLGSQAHNGKRLGRDGKFIEDKNEFGQEWQVIPEIDGALFHSYEGAVVGKKCKMPPTLTK